MTKVITNKDNYNSKKCILNWPPSKNEIKNVLRSVKKIFSRKNTKILIKWDKPKIMTEINGEQIVNINQLFIRKKFKNKGKSLELLIIKKII